MLRKVFGLRKLFGTALIAAVAACTPPSATAPETPVEAASVGDLAVVAAPASGARVTNPLVITGTAPAAWYFENQFPVQLLDVQGAVIAEGPATPRVSWTDPGDKVFDATLNFSVTADTPAVLVLQQDMVPEGETPREVRVDVVLAAE